PLLLRCLEQALGRSLSIGRPIAVRTIYAYETLLRVCTLFACMVTVPAQGETLPPLPDAAHVQTCTNGRVSYIGQATHSKAAAGRRKLLNHGARQGALAKHGRESSSES